VAPLLSVSPVVMSTAPNATQSSAPSRSFIAVFPFAERPVKGT
jgi:hypothetical protein